ncbi:mucin-5AC-like isoform X2 [Bradysia coprophila]|uniref:mucin-5AC-like isoform X2 n=1 Tax=Bradysia coprophila TaxID=38358 RepID=UPI00187DC6B9|nr:mucin-5AC-like isoform X2 [Bradysia coprophila]
MVYKKYFILVLTLIAFAYAENSEPITSNSTTAESSLTPAIDNSSTSATDNSSTSATEYITVPRTENISIPTTANNSTSTIEILSIPTNVKITENNTAINASLTTTSTNAENTTAAANAFKNVCVLIKLDLQLNNNTYKISSGDVNNTVLSCSNQSATIRWGKMLNSRISFHFESDADTKNFMISHIDLTVDATDNMNATDDKPIEFVYKPTGNFKVPIGKSYNCSAVKNPFAPLQNGTSVKITTTNVQLEAFRNSRTHVFSSPVFCAEDEAPMSGLDTGSIVVISVVVILLAAIALIVYLRKRNNSNIFGASARNVSVAE